MKNVGETLRAYNQMSTLNENISSTKLFSQFHVWSYNFQTLAIFQLWTYVFHMWSHLQTLPITEYTWFRHDYTWSDMTVPAQTWLYLARHGYTWSEMTIPGQTWRILLEKNYFFSFVRNYPFLFWKTKTKRFYHKFSKRITSFVTCLIFSTRQVTNKKITNYTGREL